ncbi:hypothetical protein ABZ742_04085 [Streptomyces albogriseolus]|uniref:hypothetical protein n=1 Tax=Streptomyces albogriseolus TaxID=1887 RepID=UPI003460DE29
MSAKGGRTYVLTHAGFRAVKVGYTAPGAARIDNLYRDGWEPYRTLDVATHAFAREIEQATLFEIRFSRLVPSYLTRREMRKYGWTETFSLALISVREVWDIVCEQAALLQLAPHITGPPDGRRHNGGTPPRRRPGDTQPYAPIARKQAALEQKKD